MIELYKKNIWNDAKTVNAIAGACFSKVNKVINCILEILDNVTKNFFIDKGVDVISF